MKIEVVAGRGRGRNEASRTSSPALDPRLALRPRHFELHHSYLIIHSVRSACIGSTRVARHAGT